MPKRDEAYMKAQRDMIARAAYDVLVEKGLYETSLRDICSAAGISIGALYIHFPTKEAAVAAAFALDYEKSREAPLTKTWDQYLSRFLGDDSGRDGFEGRAGRRFRLALQFVAELTQYDRNPAEMSAASQLHRSHLATCLAELKANGVITMPLGLDTTIELHSQLIGGLSYRLASDRDADPELALAAAVAGLAMSAGLKRQDGRDQGA